MALKIKYHNKAKYLAVEVSGQWEQYDARKAIESIRDAANKRKQTRLFLDSRSLEPSKSEMTRFFVGEYIAKHWGHPFRAAVLRLPKSYFGGFVETVAVNRAASIKVFFEKEEALEWLLEKSNKKNTGDGK